MGALPAHDTGGTGQGDNRSPTLRFHCSCRVLYTQEYRPGQYRHGVIEVLCAGLHDGADRADNASIVNHAGQWTKLCLSKRYGGGNIIFAGDICRVKDGRIA